MENIHVMINYSLEEKQWRWTISSLNGEDKKNIAVDHHEYCRQVEVAKKASLLPKCEFYCDTLKITREENSWRWALRNAKEITEGQRRVGQKTLLIDNKISFTMPTEASMGIVRYLENLKTSYERSQGHL